jgi:hypothetical protein
MFLPLLPPLQHSLWYLWLSFFFIYFLLFLLLLFVFLMITILTGMKWNLSVLLICISFMGEDVEYFFMCFLAIWTSFENSLFNLLAHLLIELPFLLAFKFLSYLHILNMNPLSNEEHAKILSHSVSCLFILIIVNFAEQKPFNWSNLICQFLCHCFFVCLFVTMLGFELRGLHLLGKDSITWAILQPICQFFPEQLESFSESHYL